MTFKFACPKCQKSIKASSEVAGKTAKCPTCGVKLKIPNPKPALAGAARARGSKPASKAKVSTPAPAANDGMLPFDDDEWDNALTNPFEAPKAEEEPQKLHDTSDPTKVKRKDLRWTKRGLLTLDFGLLIGGACYLLQLVCGLLGIELGETFRIVIVGFYGLAGLLMLVGPYFCITVPEQTGAKQMALTSAIAQTLAIVMGFAMFYAIGRGASGGRVDPTEVVASATLLFVASMVSYFTFVNFIKKLAEFLGNQEVANSAATVLMIGVVEGLCVVLAFIMPMLATSLTDMAWLLTISGLCYLTAVIGGYIAAFMYVGCIFRLSREMPG